MMDAPWQDETLESFDNIELRGFHVRPEGAKAIVILIHGYGEQIQAYEDLVKSWVTAGFGVYGFDLRGHGKSGGHRGYARQFEDYLDDLDLIWARVEAHAEKLPIFLIGQDLGGLVAGIFVASRKPSMAGLVLCGIPFQLPLTSMQFKLCRVLSKITPRRSFGLHKLSYLAFGEEKPADSDLGFQAVGMPCRLIIEISLAIGQVMEDADCLLGPLLIIHGRKDPFGPEKQVQELHDLAMSFDKSIWLLEGASHRILSREDRFAVNQRLLDWMNQRYNRPSEADSLDD